MKEFYLDLLFPKKCINCRKLGEFLCNKCEREIIFIKSATCLGCGKLTKRGEYCKRCKVKTALNGVIISSYFEGPIKELVHAFKYENLSSLDKLLGGYLTKTLINNLFYNNIPAQMELQNKKTSTYIITYVPMHRSKQNKRGYNQSELLAGYISKELGIEMAELLIKTRKTKPQIELKKKERLLNQKNVFIIYKRNKERIKGKDIIIVDDVVTTGATLNECAKVLKEKGAKSVLGLVLSRH